MVCIYIKRSKFEVEGREEYLLFGKGHEVSMVKLLTTAYNLLVELSKYIAVHSKQMGCPRNILGVGTISQMYHAT